MFYYIDKNGKKKKYVGNVNKDIKTGKYTGVLTETVKTIKTVELTPKDAFDKILSSEVKFTYNGKNFTDVENLQQDENATYYFIEKENKRFDLKFNPEIPEKTYFTYVTKYPLLYNKTLLNVLFKKIKIKLLRNKD